MNFFKIVTVISVLNLLSLGCVLSFSNYIDNNSDDAISAEIVDLPGLSFTPNFKHYSGYLKASDTRFLHYWFVESQGNPQSDPILLWLNGGPGCSSLDGLLSELGPFHIRPDGKTVYENPNSWNRIANVLFMEAPAGVGFSYSTDGNVTTDDDLTSLLNYNAVKEFFRLYPKFGNNKFFITGESYGGIYVPTLSARVLEGLIDFPLNFQGLAVGNGMLSFPLNTPTLVSFAYNHGLIGQKMFKAMESKCCAGCVETCQFTQVSEECQHYVNKVTNIVEGIGLNMYDLYRDCAGSVEHYPRYKHDKNSLLFGGRKNIIDKQSKARKSVGSAQSGVHESIPCLNTTAVTNYLNQPDVRSALHIPVDIPTWAVCSEAVGEAYHTTYKSMTGQFEKILSHKARILVYNGDTDMACNFLMGEQFVASLNLPLLNDTTQWKCDGQIAGFVTQYTFVDFVTVKGAGHMVPQWRAPQAFQMITNFINKLPY